MEELLEGLIGVVAVDRPHSLELRPNLHEVRHREPKLGQVVIGRLGGVRISAELLPNLGQISAFEILDPVDDGSSVLAMNGEVNPVKRWLKAARRLIR